MSTATSTATRTAPRTATSTRAHRPLDPPVRHHVASVAPGRHDARQTARGTGALVLTRRGRRLIRTVVLGLTTTVVAAVLVLAWLGAAASVAPGASAGDGEPGVVSGALSSLAAPEVSDPVEVVVRPGDTLWQIARSSAPERDPRSVVADIVRVNDLSSTAVAAGAVLVVPGS